MAKNRTGLFDKLFVLYLICTTVLFLIIIVSYYRIEKRSFDNSLIQKSGLIHDLLEISCVDPIVNTIAYDRINQSIEALYKKNHEIIYIEIYDPTAHIIASVGELPEVHLSVQDINVLIQQNSNSYMSSKGNAASKELITYLEAEDHSLGLVRIEFSRKYLYEQLKGNILYFLGIFIIAIAVTSLIFYVFTNAWIISPIGNVSKIMKNYGRDELHTILSKIKRCNQTITQDEIGVMSSAFERMISSIIERTEEKEKAEKKYRLIAENIADVIWTLDMDLRFTYISPSVYQQRGYTVEEAMKQSLEEILLPDSHKKVSNLHQQKMMFIETGDLRGWKPEVLEIEQYCKDGTTIWTSNNVMIFSGVDGKPAGILGTTHNINDRKLAEKALAEEKEQLAVTLRSIGDGVITTDISGKIVLLNKVAEELTGWSSEEAAGMPSAEVFHIIDAESLEVCEDPVTKIISSGQVIGLVSNHTVLIARDGRKRNIADSGSPILDAKSNIIGVVLVFRDVTETQRMEQEALKVRKLESVGVLAGGIAHDFNNILTAILGNINLALDCTAPHESIYALLSEAEKASLRAKHLTQQLLTFSKGGEPVRKSTSIAEIITDSSSFILRGSNVRCNTSFASDLFPVDIDPGQISQVIQNIIINGAHAMPQGGVIGIWGENISERQHIPSSLYGDRYVVVTIQDHGVGIPDKIVDKIFDPYFSTKQTGSGLGLAICHSIITRHGGLITVESVPEKGTTFSIYLAASEKQLPDSIAKEAGPRVNGHGKIMVMDDDEMVRTMVKAMLSHLGYEIELSADGEEAIALYKKAMSTGTQADLIIMDLTVPGAMGGEDAVKEILAINPEAKVLVSSGYSNDPIMADYKNYGFSGAIVKPYRIQELNTILQGLL